MVFGREKQAYTSSDIRRPTFFRSESESSAEVTDVDHPAEDATTPSNINYECAMEMEDLGRRPTDTKNANGMHSRALEPLSDVSETEQEVASPGPAGMYELDKDAAEAPTQERSSVTSHKGKKDQTTNSEPPPTYAEASSSHNKMSSFFIGLPRSLSLTRVDDTPESVPLSSSMHGPTSSCTAEIPQRPRVPQHSDNIITAAAANMRYPSSRPEYDIKKVHVAPVAKFFLFFSNMIASFIGLATVAVGTYTSITQGTFTDLSGFGTDPAALLIVAGCLILFVGMCGLIGSLRENYMLLRIFHGTLMLMLMLQLIGGLLIYFLQARVKNAAGKEVVDAIKKYQTAPLPTALDDAIIQVQLRFQCCGATQARDWRDNSPYFACNSQEVFETLYSACSVPASCCQTDALTNAQCGYKVFAYPNMTATEIAKYPRIGERNTIIWSTGCVNAVYDWLKTNWVTIACACGGVFLFQILGLEASRKLIDSLKCIKTKGHLI
ncbi:tetraspanin-33-like [Sycon ciliatum]|uniref:tetraspanin-33-like n=1 Tax=Sycon ciliatum TaxID=27933 RepID=UPI0020AC9E68